MKKITIIISLFLLVLLVSGCEEKKNVTINGKTVNTAKMEHKHCTRNGSLTGGEVELEYDVYYTGDNINIVKTMEKVISDDQEILNTYEEAYKGIHSHYEGLENYETSVVRDNNSVASYINVNYDEVDIDKLIAIEGEEDNIFENKVPKVSKWLELGEKLGAQCELVED